MRTNDRLLTEQEQFWKGEFGKNYIARNRSDTMIASNLHFFARVLERCPGGVRSLVEFGANIGMNLRALRLLLPGASLNAVEINAEAAGELKAWGGCERVENVSLFDYDTATKCDLVLVKGVLIHLNPDLLSLAYDQLAGASSRYVCMAEYYNPVPVEVPYRGHAGKLFKRDFAGEFLDRHPDFRLVDYGFAYRRDPLFPADDLTWFLLERRTI